MKIIYLLPTPPPKSDQVEAIAQEIAALRRSFEGEVVYVNPNNALPRPLVPRIGFGLHNLAKLNWIGRDADLFHFFNPDAFPFPFLLALTKPVVYTITAGVARRPKIAYLRRMGMVTVADERSLAKLQGWGLQNVAWQRPGIDTTRFSHRPLALTPDQPLRLLVASAPWTVGQFASKGFTALLAVTQRLPDLRLTLLWRGHLAGEIRRRIAEAGIGDKVTVIDETVDVNQALAGVHAAAIFAAAPGILKSYPNSLLDALAAGKPVMLNSLLAMSDYVNKEQCGVVVEAVTPEAILFGIAQLRAGYSQFARNAEEIGRRDFTEEAALRVARTIYSMAQPKAIVNG